MRRKIVCPQCGYTYSEIVWGEDEIAAGGFPEKLKARMRAARDAIRHCPICEIEIGFEPT